ncbi:hypothetical protein ACLBYN_13225, partial [Pseudomonas aeruginosa]
GCAKRARSAIRHCAGWWRSCWRKISSRPWPASAPFIIPFILGYTACSYYVFRGKSADAGYH